ncbi:MAG: MBL fold metallo-hydrolase [Breznakia sp.]
MLKFFLLASGSKGNSCIVEDEHTSIVIDCGGPKRYLMDCFSKITYDHSKTKALFITHEHKDHIERLKMFDNIPTYAMCSLPIKHYNKVNAYDTIAIDTLAIRVIPTSHDTKDSCGFVVTSKQEKLVYMTDTGYISDEIKPYLINADFYVFESNHDLEMLMKTDRPAFIKQRIASDAGHLCNEDSAKALSELVGENTKEIVLAHISEAGNSKSLAMQTLQQAFQRQQINYEHIRMIAASQFEIVFGGKQQ